MPDKNLTNIDTFPAKDCPNLSRLSIIINPSRQSKYYSTLHDYLSKQL